MESIPFLIARRRNEQRRTGESWISRLSQATALPLDSIQLVTAEESIPKERRRKELMKELLKTGALTRRCGCSFDEANTAWKSCLARRPSEVVECHLAHSPDFPFRTRAGAIVDRLDALIAFDGDTVVLASSGLERGLAVDMYCDDGQGTRFETDTWGEW